MRIVRRSLIPRSADLHSVRGVLLQNHSDAKHGKAGIPKRGVDPRTQFLAIALVAIVGAFCLLAFWFTPEMVP